MRFHAPHASAMGKRDAGSDAPAKGFSRCLQREKKLFEVEDFVRSTRRWYDRGNPRDAGDPDACQTVFLVNNYNA